MESRPFVGVPVPVMGQGTWQIVPGPDLVRTLQRGLDLGMTHIDTAELYRGAEEVVADAIEGRRDEVFLVSKVLPRNATRGGVVSACDRSLRRLRTDRLDCYLLHWTDGRVPIAETMAGMVDLLSAGKIRSVGVSNLSVLDMTRAAEGLGDVPLACNQVLYNLADRGIERDVLPWCAARGVAVVGYTPFGGLAAGTPAWAALHRVGARHGRTPRQVVLRYLTRHPGTFAIPKASTVAHVEENAGGCGFDLSPEDVADIEAAFS